MGTTSNPTYRISWRSRLVVATSLLLAALFVLAWLSDALVLVLLLALPLVAMVLVPAVTVRPDGMSLYGVNHLQWNEVVSVRATRVLGLPYAVVQRQKGMQWWVPLYVDDRRGLFATLASRAPAGNALHAFAAMGPEPSFNLSH